MQIAISDDWHQAQRASGLPGVDETMAVIAWHNRFHGLPQVAFEILLEIHKT